MHDRPSTSESAAATAFFCVLVRHVHFETNTWEYADTIGHEAGYTQEQVDSYVYMLEAAGLIEIRMSQGPSGAERTLIQLTVSGREYARTVCTDGY